MKDSEKHFATFSVAVTVSSLKKITKQIRKKVKGVCIQQSVCYKKIHTQNV
jgi:hypothetical protein